jgi:hypothetical protein
MKKWWLWGCLFLFFILGIRLLANYQQHSRLHDMQVAPAVVAHINRAEERDIPPPLVDDWRGQTGLSAEAESQLISFLHLKLGELDDDPSALQPEEMTYLGAYAQEEGLVRYWLLPQGYGALYATVTLVDGSAPVYGLASTPPSDADAVGDSDGQDSGQPMEPDVGDPEPVNPLDLLHVNKDSPRPH